MFGLNFFGIFACVILGDFFVIHCHLLIRHFTSFHLQQFTNICVYYLHWIVMVKLIQYIKTISDVSDIKVYYYSLNVHGHQPNKSTCNTCRRFDIISIHKKKLMWHVERFTCAIRLIISIDRLKNFKEQGYLFIIIIACNRRVSEI